MSESSINGYELSRDWFDFCFENPELITPTHTAMYFFIIEHWNRLGQKEKFGLPMEMTKDAIGIKNYKTFSKTFNDIIDWGFVKILQRSKNQYSANVIALVKNTKANTKALAKASLKHSQKQVHGIVGIDKPNNQELSNLLTSKGWRDDFEIYKSEMYECFERLKTDTKFISEQERLNPNVDVLISIEKSIKNYWEVPSKGWKNKKSDKDTKNINWTLTFQNAITQPMNKTFKQKNGSQQLSFQQNLSEMDYTK